MRVLFLKNDKKSSSAKFDGLSEDYDKYRPRYPDSLVQVICNSVSGKKKLSVVDAGSGTGIFLEKLISFMGLDNEYTAIELSNDMINIGRSKFPFVNWVEGKAESLLHDINEINLIVFAQSFQWMDRDKVLSILSEKMNKGDVIAIIQNNRNFHESVFLDEYESLLEKYSPNYSRYYRSFNFYKDFENSFKNCCLSFHKEDWNNKVKVEDFIGMSKSSTQVKRAIDSVGDVFIKELKNLLTERQIDGFIDILYKSELYLCIKN
ncbi:hypothetical protein AB832_08205 [Flavobacteriaceae bacterium (ex Bugula neritina AB1)]|nr:hypothetical protein AB832_08205 [Flavobacteriaceae bacterium (ex Bugula neritina AB1)]